MPHGIHIPHSHKGHEGKPAKTAISSPWAAPTAETEERKAADKFAKMIDGRSFDPGLFAFFMDKQPSTTQFQMFDIMVNLISIWGEYYQNGQATPEMGKGYAMCKWAYEVSTMKHPQPPK